MNVENYFDFAIIGAGCIGASTALAVKRRWPDVKVVLFDADYEHTASKDINKIVRTPYPDADYVLLAKEAQKCWESVSPYSEYYHRTGWVQVLQPDGETFESLKEPNDQLVSHHELMNMIGARSIPHLLENEELWLNEDIGVCFAAPALQAVVDLVASLGTELRRQQVSHVSNVKGMGCEIHLANGESVSAGKAIIAAGPWTPQLLEDSGIEYPDGFFTIRGGGVATLDLDEESYQKMKSMPILATEKGDIFPPSGSSRRLKIITLKTFPVKKLGRVESECQKEAWISTIDEILGKMLPHLQGRPLKYWFCCDLFVPYQHPLVDKVLGVDNVYVVAGGSYHAFKFMPVIGEMVVRRIVGKAHQQDDVKDRLLKRWGWDRSRETVAVHEDVLNDAKLGGAS